MTVSPLYQRWSAGSRNAWRFHARDGEVIGEFATQRRVIIGYDDIPEVLRQAIISAEDATFFEHNEIHAAGIQAAGYQTTG